MNDYLSKVVVSSPLRGGERMREGVVRESNIRSCSSFLVVDETGAVDANAFAGTPLSRVLLGRIQEHGPVG